MAGLLLHSSRFAFDQVATVNYGNQKVESVSEGDLAISKKTLAELAKPDARERFSKNLSTDQQNELNSTFSTNSPGNPATMSLEMESKKTAERDAADSFSAPSAIRR